MSLPPPARKGGGGERKLLYNKWIVPLCAIPPCARHRNA